MERCRWCVPTTHVTASAGPHARLRSLAFLVSGSAASGLGELVQLEESQSRTNVCARVSRTSPKTATHVLPRPRTTGLAFITQACEEFGAASVDVADYIKTWNVHGHEIMRTDSAV